MDGARIQTGSRSCAVVTVGITLWTSAAAAAATAAAAASAAAAAAATAAEAVLAGPPSLTTALSCINFSL